MDNPSHVSLEMSEQFTSLGRAAATVEQWRNDVESVSSEATRSLLRPPSAAPSVARSRSIAPLPSHAGGSTVSRRTTADPMVVTVTRTPTSVSVPPSRSDRSNLSALTHRSRRTATPSIPPTFSDAQRDRVLGEPAHRTVSVHPPPSYASRSRSQVSSTSRNSSVTSVHTVRPDQVYSISPTSRLDSYAASVSTARGQHHHDFSSEIPVAHSIAPSVSVHSSASQVAPRVAAVGSPTPRFGNQWEASRAPATVRNNANRALDLSEGTIDSIAQQVADRLSIAGSETSSRHSYHECASRSSSKQSGKSKSSKSRKLTNGERFALGAAVVTGAAQVRMRKDGKLKIKV